MRLVADSEAVVSHITGSERLSAAREALTGAAVDGGLVVSVASLIDLRYVTLMTKGAPKDDLDRLRAGLLASELVALPPIRGAANRWERL